MKPMIQFKNCSLGYGKKIILSNINLTLYQNDFLGIVGPNGVGKTTILKNFLKFIRPLSGEINFNAQSYKIGYVPQRGNLDPIYPLTVYDVVLMSRYKVKETKKEKVKAVEKVLKYVDVYDLKNQLYRDVSGGQKQRVLIARALAIEPEILILDEPTNGMDIKSQKNILDLLKRLHFEKKLTIVLVTHLLNEILPYINKIFLLKNYGYLYGDTEIIVNDKNLSHFYDASINVITVKNKKIVIVR